MIPIVKDVFVLGTGSPSRACSGIFAFLAFQSQRAISKPAYEPAEIFNSLDKDSISEIDLSLILV